ncbi:hypothetical protein IMSAGC021_01731 [Muribaculaceae bacterium]|nr:hypothetical protein IMSAGC021_01731 [Muribaculaceae bacterium]
MIGPDTGEEIGLEFDAHTDVVGFGFTYAVHLRMGFVKYAEQMLYMMPDFMGYHIGVCEISIGSESLAHVTEK